MIENKFKSLNEKPALGRCFLTLILSLLFVLPGNLFFITSAFSAEVDSFTQRHQLSDSRSALNTIVNLWLTEAIAEANRKSKLLSLTKKEQFDEDDFFLNENTSESKLENKPFQDKHEQANKDKIPQENRQKAELNVENGENNENEQTAQCSRPVLFNSLKDKFAGFLIGQLETYVNNSNTLDTIKVNFKDSIYRDFKLSETPTISFTEKLSAIVRIRDTYFGADKFGHFFTEGLSYYEIVTTINQSSALQFGELSENFLYGELTTGVYSYSDLAANLNGLRFWNRILALKPDPLYPGTSSTPYVSCINNQWQQTEHFDWAEYVDPTWDEAINCSAFRNDVLLDKVKSNIKNATGGKNCPLAHIQQKPLVEKYGNLLSHLYNPNGNMVVTAPLRPKFNLLWSNIVGVINSKILPEGFKSPTFLSNDN